MSIKKQNVLFVVCAYAFFWVLIIGAGSVQMSGNEELFSKILPFVQIVGTWAPTFALLVLFKKLYLGWTIKEFCKNAFRERLNFKVLLVVTISYLLITVGIVGISALTKEVSFISLLDYSFLGFVITLFSGAMGEEAGWRGFFQQSTEKKYSVIKASLIVGIIWAFWHAPTWIMTPLQYIPLDILSKMSGAMIIGICYSRCRNLIVPMWIHFVMNISVNGIQGVLLDSYFSYVLLVLLEALVAIGYIIWHNKGAATQKSVDNLAT